MLYESAAEPGAWPFDINKEATHLYEDLPSPFGFVGVMKAAACPCPCCRTGTGSTGGRSKAPMIRSNSTSAPGR